MNCNHCDVPMLLIKQETTERSLVKWHKCPNCGRAHLLSEPNFDDLDSSLGLRSQKPEFRSSRSKVHGAAYSGPERRGPHRRRSVAF